MFEECGKAVLFRHASDHYRSMLRAAQSDVELCQLEHAGFGVSHDALGAALCESWGLGAAAVASVRFHVQARDAAELPAPVGKRGILALSLVARALMDAPAELEDVVTRVAPQAELDATALLRAARRVYEQLEQAAANGR